jgi:hypothetical protein
MQDRHPKANVTKDFAETFADRGRLVHNGISRPGLEKPDYRQGHLLRVQRAAIPAPLRQAQI